MKSSEKASGAGTEAHEEKSSEKVSGVGGKAHEVKSSTNVSLIIICDKL